MFVIWPVIISMTLGVICGYWIPLFHFVIVALVECLGSALILWLSGHDMLTAVLGFIAVGVALQFGYVFGILGSFAVSRLWPNAQMRMVKYSPKHDTSLS